MTGMAGPELKPRSARKSATAYRTISEVSDDLAVPQHVLRFWETKFSQVRPLKRGGGRRYYRPEDIQLLRRIQRLLYEDGYTIKGVQRLLKEPKGQGAAVIETESLPFDDEDEAETAPPADLAPEPPPTQTVPAAATPAAGAPTALSPELRAELTALLSDLKRLRSALLGEE